MPAALSGIRVVVTRARDQAKSLVSLLENNGARVELLPLLEIRPPDDEEALRRAARRLRAEWIVLTSTNAVDAFAGARATPLPAGVAIAVVGGATAEAARRLGLAPDVVATDSRAAGPLALI